MSPLRLTHWLAITGLLVFLGGCGCNPKPYNIEVTLADSLKDRTVYVHLVGLNDTNGQILSAKSMTAYWQPNDSLMDSLDIYKITFLEGQSRVHTLSRADPIWDRWDNETNLYVLASLPGSFSDQPGQLDARRLILPLGSCRWEGDTVKVLVNEGLVTHTSTLLPEPD
ncbi:hypothetical protein OT109_15560 [Phycisphaeraceae bacterium D3-23]